MIIDDFVGNFVATTRDKNLVFCRKFSCHRVGQQARLALRMWPQPWKFCEPFFGQLENLFLENLLIFYSHHMKTHKRHENFEIFPWGVIVEIISSYLKKVFILSFTYIFESRCTIKFPWISKKKKKPVKNQKRMHKQIIEQTYFTFSFWCFAFPPTAGPLATLGLSVRWQKAVFMLNAYGGCANNKDI